MKFLTNTGVHPLYAACIAELYKEPCRPLHVDKYVVFLRFMVFVTVSLRALVFSASMDSVFQNRLTCSWFFLSIRSKWIIQN